MHWTWVEWTITGASWAIVIASIVLQMTVMRKQRKLITELVEASKLNLSTIFALENGMDHAARLVPGGFEIRVVAREYDVTFPRKSTIPASNFSAIPPGIIQ